MNELITQPIHAPLAVKTESQALVMVEHAYYVLGLALDFQATREVQSMAVAAAAYAREAGDDRLLTRATELRTRAQRKAGQMLIEAAKNGQRATQASHGKGIQSSVEGADTRPTLAQIGITRDQSSKWQKVAQLSDAVFEQTLEMTKAVTAEVSADKILRSARPAPVHHDYDPDDSVPVIEPEIPSLDFQAISFYNAVRDLSALTCTAEELESALPFYQHFRVFKGLAPAIALLQKVSETWKFKN